MSAPKLIPALLGGLFIGVLSSLPIIEKGNLCCCLWVVMGGVLAAWLMQQNTPRPVTLGEGALVGLLAGIVGAVAMLGVKLGLSLVFGMPAVVDEVRRGMEAGARDPESRALVEGMGPIVLVGIIVVAAGLASTVMSTIGGLLGAVIFRRKSGGQAPPPTPSMPPPSGFTPPTFTPPAPPAPPSILPPMPPPAPPAPPVPPSPAEPAASAATVLIPAFAPEPPPRLEPEPEPEPEPYADAPTMLIPMRGPTLGPPPTPAARPSPPPAGDTEPESH